MIFEDLVSKGYSVIRNRSANKEELRSALEKLAKWHAVSHKLLKEQPELFEELKYDVSTLPNMLEQDYMTTALPTFIEMLGNVEHLKPYQKYFESMRGKLINRWVDIMEEYRSNRQADGYYVLCHGDYHLRNLMVKHNPSDKSLEDCMLLDFQMCHVCPISADLLYSIYLLMGPEERRYHYKELIDFYFSTFVETLQNIGYKGELPNLVEFWKQLHRHKLLGKFL